jgi:hypothetical protein
MDELIHLNIYGFYIFTIYLVKLIWVIMLAVYFWYHGGLKKVERELEFDSNSDSSEFSKESLISD